MLQNNPRCLYAYLNKHQSSKLVFAHLREALVFTGDPLVFGFDREFVLGCSVVQARTRLRDGI